MHGEPVKPRQPKMGLSAAFGSAPTGRPRAAKTLVADCIQLASLESLSSMATFDAPNREVCTLKRDRTNTPLQALVTLNDPVFVEALRTGSADRASRVFLSAIGLANPKCLPKRWTGRTPRPRAFGTGGNFTIDVDSSSRPIQVRLNKCDRSSWAFAKWCRHRKLATWTAISNVLLNLDEVLMTR